MLVRIAVSDPLPVFRQGIATTLGRAGFDTDEPDDLMAWVDQMQRTVVVLTVRGADDWNLLEQLCQTHDEVIVLAMLDDASTPAYVRALSAGAVAALPRNATPGMVLGAFQAAIRGASLVPVEVIRALSAQGQKDGPPAAPGNRDLSADQPTGPAAAGQVLEQERRWLRQLAAGMTVGRLAAQESYSERMMFRLLRALYGKLGAQTRTEALMKAHDRGLL